MKLNIQAFDTITSTNDEAIRQAKLGVDEGLCIISRHQTAGRGRNGRSWVSPIDSGLYFSIVLRPKFDVKFVPLLTLMSAIAVFETLKTSFQILPDIKWVNDIHARGKKISGILAEAFDTNKGLAVVVGIGINLTSGNFPDQLNDIATSIEDITSVMPDREILLQNLTLNFSNLYQNFDPQKIREMWSERSSYAFNKSVSVALEHETIFGITRGIVENGALRVEISGGEIVVVQAGDVASLRQT
jgi:BirA family transcriptional regulator, biotin operon repressor / biotin---[acetyl-CoA-carboxylase] ligase